MSFVMIAGGPTGCSRIRTVSIRSLLYGGGLVAAGLLAAGTGLGYWIAGSTPALQQRAHSAPPFTVEQLGSLSGRLFQLESQAGQLIERMGLTKRAAPQPEPAASATDAARGGPLLPPRLEQTALQDLVAFEARFAQIEQQMALVSDAASQQNLALMRLPSRLPIKDADLVSSFGNRADPFTGRRAFHAGLDFAAGLGTPIHAAAGGTVAFAGFRPDFGRVVEIEHGNGLTTRYAHASRLLVKTGAIVAPGDPIAAVGSTGRSTGPHLHFEVLRHGEATDPRPYLAGL